MSRRRTGSRPAGTHRVLVAGGGVAALEATLTLRALAGDRVSIELLAPEPQFWYRPLSVLEPFGIGHVHGVELVDLARAAGAHFTLGGLSTVDTDRHIALTARGAEYEYDALLVASGAKPVTAVPGAFTFRGPADSPAFGTLLTELASGSVRHLVFAVPGGVAWPLPIYELALLTATFLERHGIEGVELTLATPEDAPLGLFGSTASAEVSRLLDERRISVLSARYPISADAGTLTLAPALSLPADRVVALPRLEGAPIGGIPTDAHGFVPTDLHGRVKGIEDVFAAGDVTDFRVKQGGIAAQQARAAAETIAAHSGADVVPQPFRPVLRGLVLTGGVPAYLRADLAGGSGQTSVADAEPLWWPPGKIAGQRLAPFLAQWAGVVLTPPKGVDAVPVEVELTH
jgi:sulfide:quinone oxidoreductase